MTARNGQRSRRGERRIVDLGRVRERWLAPRERAGLVEHDGVDLRQALQAVRCFDDNALGKQATCRGHLHRGNRQRQRAGTRDDEHGDGVGQRLLEAATDDEPRQQRRGSKDMHSWRIETCRAIGEPHVLAPPLLCRGNEPGNLGEQRVVIGCSRLDDDGARQVDRAGMHRSRRQPSDAARSRR